MSLKSVCLFRWLQGVSVLPRVLWGNTRPTESPGPRSARLSCWRWRGSSGRNSTCPSPNGPSSPAHSTWRRLRWRSGFRTDELKPSGSRRPNSRSLKWPLNRCFLRPSGFHSQSALTFPLHIQDHISFTDTPWAWLRWDSTHTWDIACII